MPRVLVLTAALTVLVNPSPLFAGPLCGGDCSLMLFGGPNVGTGLDTIALEEQLPPDQWDFEDSYFVGVNASRRIASLFEVIDLEAELGAGQRFNGLDETEVWGALYLRYTAFPWNGILRTTVALNTGLNYATG